MENQCRMKWTRSAVGRSVKCDNHLADCSDSPTGSDGEVLSDRGFRSTPTRKSRYGRPIEQEVSLRREITIPVVESLL